MLKIVLIGAGVAGGIIAQGLAAIPGIEVTLVEQVSEQDHAMAGNGLNIGPNALTALTASLPGIAAELRAASLPWTRWKGSLASGETLYEIPLAEVAGCHGIRIRWSELYRIVRQAVAGVTLYNQRFIDIRNDGAKATVVLEDTASGSRRSIDGIDLVIASDGRYSRVREICVGMPSIRHLRVGNFRLLIDDKGESATGDLEEWYNGPYRLLAFRLADGRIYLSGNFPVAPSGEIEEEQKTPAFMRQHFLPAQGPVLPVCRYLLEAACDDLDALHWARSQEIDTCFRDAGGHVLFVGDSAHAMAPTLGQGATQAIEDASLFVALFREMYDRAGFSVPALTAAFDALRRDRIEFVKSFSWDATKPLLAGSEPVSANAYKRSDAYRAELRRLYCDLPPIPA